MTGPVFSLRELSTDLKSTDFHFQNLSKNTRFRGKALHKHYIYENCNWFFFVLFLRLTIFEIIFIFIIFILKFILILK